VREDFLNKYLIVVVTVVLFVFALGQITQAQEFSAGIQSPLAAFGQVSVGPIAISLGVPLRFNFASLSAWTTAKWLIGAWDLASFETKPYLGANAQALLIGEATYLSWSVLAGLEIHIPETQLKLFGQLGFDPNFSTGLIESLSFGVGYHF
jgi:hypothetical protein